MSKMKKIKVGVVTARFNSEITEKLREGAHRILEKAGVKIWSVQVPGAVEISLATQELIEQGCAGVVTLGAVIRGETPHFEYVNQSVERSLTQLILDYRTPIGFGVLTVENWTQAEERVGGKHGHKGEEAAQAVLEMIELQTEIRSGKSGNLEKKKKTDEVGSAKAKRLRRDS